MPDTIDFDFGALSGREKYKLMIGAIVPRPIALVTTVDPDGRVNAAPFSFFNCLSSDPPILALGIENRPDMAFKRTARNIRLTEVFTVNIVSMAMAESMHVCAADLPDGMNELAIAGLTARPGKAVASPWIAQYPAAFDCRRTVALERGRSRQIILGEIVHAHCHADVVDRDRFTVHPAKLDVIARMGGDTCCTTRDRMEIAAPRASDLLVGQSATPPVETGVTDVTKPADGRAIPAALLRAAGRAPSGNARHEERRSSGRRRSAPSSDRSGSVIGGSGRRTCRPAGQPLRRSRRSRGQCDRKTGTGGTASMLCVAPPSTISRHLE